MFAGLLADLNTFAVDHDVLATVLGRATRVLRLSERDARRYSEEAGDKNDLFHVGVALVDGAAKLAGTRPMVNPAAAKWLTRRYPVNTFFAGEARRGTHRLCARIAPTYVCAG